jgi:hypothetical protein
MQARTLDSFEILSEPRNGPYFEVYRARDATTNRVVALKTRVLSADDWLRRLSCFDIFTDLRHPTIVGHYALLSQGSSTFIA